MRDTAALANGDLVYPLPCLVFASML